MKTEVLTEEHGLMALHLAGDRDTIVYEKAGFTPADYTILNFEVDDIDVAAEELAARGVSFERYDGIDQDEKGIARGPGPQIAWFKDPAGNTLSVLQQPSRAAPDSMAKRKQRRKPKEKAPTIDYVDAEGNMLTLRQSLSPKTIAKIGEGPARLATSLDDAWRRR